MQIYRKQGRFTELLSVLENPHVGIESEVAKNDFEFIRIKLETLRQEEKWTELWHYCIGLLRKAYQALGNEVSNGITPPFVSWASDWALWKALLDATEALNDPQ